MSRRPLEQLPRLALSPDEAARALGVSRDFFDHHVLPELRVVRRGRRRLIPTWELDRWLADNAAVTVGNDRSRSRPDSWLNTGSGASVAQTRKRAGTASTAPPRHQEDRPDA